MILVDQNLLVYFHHRHTWDIGIKNFYQKFELKKFFTVRLKYEDTHSDQKLSENELYPLIAWERPRNANALRE